MTAQADATRCAADVQGEHVTSLSRWREALLSMMLAVFVPATRRPTDSLRNVEPRAIQEVEFS